MPTWAKAIVYLAVMALIVSVTINVYLGLGLRALTAGPAQEVYRTGDRANAILVLPIEGTISNDTDRFVQTALAVVRRQQPKAVILRIDSHGGSAFASDRIAHHIKKLRRQVDIPIVASFGGIAASGGYYVSAGADQIVAEPNTITGSIGVVSVFLNIKGLLEERLSIEPHVELADASPRKLEGAHPFRYDERDREAMKDLLNHLHESFVNVVREGRSGRFEEDDLERITSGATFVAPEAEKIGLVDRIGYFDDAIEVAKELAGIPEDIDPQVTIIRPQRGLLGVLFGARGGGQKPLTDISGEQARQWLLDATGVRFEYRWYPGH